MRGILENRGDQTPLHRLRAVAFTIPTDFPEADGTLEWDRTTLVVVEAEAGGMHGLGYGYADESTAHLINSTLVPVINGMSAMSTNAAWWAMVRRIRNLGRPGICSMAVSCVDVALWDLKAKLLGVPVVQLLGGAVRESVDVYGSGGFTSYSDEQLADQFRRWFKDGIGMMKMKVGRDASIDLQRVRVAREAIEGAELFVDANGGYGRKEALAMAERFAEFDVTWFEEPVSSDDLEGLRLVRDRAPASMNIAAGEYGYDAYYFRRMVDAGAVDVLQADATRCGGMTGFLQAAQLCVAHGLPLSAHTAPTLHAALGCACQQVRHLEYFHDHVRIEQMLFDGAPVPIGGKLSPDCSRPGLGLELKRADAERFAA
jgi:L-alanine-DL-glutamate epimerase-like enolase superfamily enzyme